MHVPFVMDRPLIEQEESRNDDWEKKASAMGPWPVR